MNYQRYILYSFVLTIIIFIFLALNADSFYFRLDLSRDQAFSISEYSRKVLRELPDDVEITYYLSPRLQTRLPVVQEISDILYEYQRISRGRLRVKIIDPDSNPSTAPEDLGISPRELQIVENNEQTFALVYSGMAISYRDSLEIIPLITNSTDVEYEITSRLLSMTQKKGTVGIMLAKSNPDPQQFQTMIQYLTQYYDLSVLQAGESIPPTIDGLAVLGMVQLDEADLYEIERFIFSGKGVLIATEAAEVDVSQGLVAQDHSDHPLLEMLAHYGIKMERSWVLDSSNLMVPFQQRQGQVVVNRYTPYPQWVQITGSHVNSDHPLTARFQGLDFYWASSLTVDDDVEGMEILFSSSPRSVLSSGFWSDPETAENELFQAQGLEAEGHSLAVSMRGELNAWFSDAPEQLVDRGVNYANPINQIKESKLVVFGDSDFASELYAVGGSNYNIQIMHSIFEYLLGDEELLEIRTRGGRNVKLNALEPSGINAVLILAKVISFGLIPLIIALFAIIRHTYRRRRAKQVFVSYINPITIPKSSEDEEE